MPFEFSNLLARCVPNPCCIIPCGSDNVTTIRAKLSDQYISLMPIELGNLPARQIPHTSRAIGGSYDDVFSIWTEVTTVNPILMPFQLDNFLTGAPPDLRLTITKP